MTSKTELNDFVELVAEMRKAQRQFFAGDKSGRLVQYAKKLERKVDDAIDAWIHPNLFESLDRENPSDCHTSEGKDNADQK